MTTATTPRFEAKYKDANGWIADKLCRFGKSLATAPYYDASTKQWKWKCNDEKDLCYLNRECAPTVSIKPTDETICSDQTLTFTAIPEDCENPKYQWLDMQGEAIKDKKGNPETKRILSWDNSWRQALSSLQVQVKVTCDCGETDPKPSSVIKVDIKEITAEVVIAENSQNSVCQRSGVAEYTIESNCQEKTNINWKVLNDKSEKQKLDTN